MCGDSPEAGDSVERELACRRPSDLVGEISDRTDIGVLAITGPLV